MKEIDSLFLSNEKVYILFLVAHALSTKQHLHPEIASVYEKRELVYYEAYRSHDIDLQQAFRHYPFEQVNAMIQCFGILEVAHQEESFQSVWNLIRKGFGPVWKYCKIHGHFSLEAMKEEMAKRSNGFIEGDTIANQFVVGLFISFYKEGVELFGSFEELDDTSIFYLTDLLDIFRNKPENRIPFFSQSHGVIGKETAVKDLEQHLRLFRKSSDMEDFIGKIIQSEMLQAKPPEPTLPSFEIPLAPPTMYDAFSEIDRYLNNYDDKIEMDKATKQGWSKYLVSLRALMVIHNFEPTSLGKLQPIDKDAIPKLYQLIGFLKEDFDYTEQELMITIVFHYYLSSIEEEYTKLRQLASDGSRERIMREMESLKEEITSLINEKKQSHLTHQSEIKLLQGQLERALDENKKLSQQIRKMELSQKENKKHAHEIHALRRYVSNHIQQQDRQEQFLTVEQMGKELQKKNIAIVGGHHKWQRKMKELLPSAKFIYVDDLNRDFNALLSVDAVFFDDTVLNHGFSYKFTDVMENSDIPIYYLSNAVNKERSLREIYEYLFD